MGLEFLDTLYLRLVSIDQVFHISENSLEVWTFSYAYNAQTWQNVHPL